MSVREEFEAVIGTWPAFFLGFMSGLGCACFLFALWVTLR